MEISRTNSLLRIKIINDHIPPYRPEQAWISDQYVKIYPFGSTISFQWKDQHTDNTGDVSARSETYFLGARFAKSLAGLTILAAIFVASVEMMIHHRNRNHQACCQFYQRSLCKSFCILNRRWWLLPVTITPTNVEKGHGWWKTDDLPVHLCLLWFCIPGKIRNIKW